MQSWVDGRGHFAFTPEVGHTYRARLDAENLVLREFALPAAKRGGCVMHHFDDLAGAQQAVRVSVACTTSKPGMATAPDENGAMPGRKR